MLRRHAGEISFPGGKVERGEEPIQTALRELCEELGICDDVKIVAKLPEVHTISTNYLVVPYVARLESVERISMGWEVEEIILVPIRELVLFERCILPRLYYIYPLSKGVIWGATARIVHSFLKRML